MSNVGFFIRKLMVTGQNVPDAELHFKKGLNVISGASDTGKSYLVECIDFMLGKQTPPKNIKEGRGYTEVFLEIETFNGIVYTLKREISGGRFLLYENGIDQIIESKSARILNAKHTSKHERNISSFLLQLSGLNKNYVVKQNMYNETSSLSFRQITNFILIDEQRIISKNSPILSGQVVSKTVDKSTFRLLITGKDSGDLEKITDPTIYKTRIEAQIELLDQLIDSVRKQTGDNYNLFNTFSPSALEQVDKDIEVLTNRIKDISISLKKNSQTKQKTWHVYESAYSRTLVLKELIQRFTILNEHYNSDLERLDFISEGGYYFSQLNLNHCPLCKDKITEFDHLAACSYEANQDMVQKACNKEIDKIRLLQKDLDDTLLSMKTELDLVTSKVNDSKKLLEDLDAVIQEELKPQEIVNRQELIDLINLKDEITKHIVNTSQLDELNKQHRLLSDQLRKKPTTDKNNNGIESDYIDGLCKNIKDILGSWNYPDLKSIAFDDKNSEFEINGNPRPNHGKGVRAIIFSAFTIALMRHCKEADLPHPGLVILDSPLTNFRDKTENNEEISESIQESFFENLASSNLNEQIIIFENKEPRDILKEQINYVHFSKMPNFGRYGFFPVFNY